MIYLVGDSHAAQWIPGIEVARHSKQLNFRFLTKSSCPFVKLNLNDDCSEWIRNVTAEINQHTPEIVLIANLTNGKYLNFYTEKEYAKLFIGRFQEILRLIPLDSQIIFIEDTPYASFDTADCLKLQKINDCQFESRTSYLTTGMRQLAKLESIPYISLNNHICLTNKCPAGDSEINFYRDEHHISASLSKRLGGHIINFLNLRFKQE